MCIWGFDFSSEGSKRRRIRRRITWGIFWLILGVFILLSNYDLLGGYRFVFSRDWPIILIAIGVILIIDVISYTIRDKNIEQSPKADANTKKPIEEILSQLEKGEITAEEALRRIKNI